MSDLIDRQAAIDCCRNEWEEEVAERIEALPSVQPQSTMGQVTDAVQSTMDCISRQAAIDGILHLMPPNPNMDDGSAEQLNFSAWKCALTCAEASIKMMPSAQPEITLESAIDYLHSIGWMQEHDELMYKQGYKHGKSKGIKRGMAIAARRKHEE